VGRSSNRKKARREAARSLRVGLTILSVVAGLCRSDSASILDRAA
jgi:hypothetical protein